MRLSAQQRLLLARMQQGHLLKVHRTLDGEKVYRFHALDGSWVEEIPPGLVTGLERAGLIRSNMKFPVAVFVLTGSV